MKRFSFFLVLFLAALYGWAQRAQFNCRIIPTPQKVEQGKGVLQKRNIKPTFKQTTSITGAENPQQAYQLVISQQGATLYFISEEGRNYGEQTLQQLERVYDGRIPCMTLTDWPAYEWRGWLDDISRGPIPNKCFREKTLRFGKYFKMNYGNYYTEHTLYNEQYPDISGISGIQVHDYEKDGYMMANLQCFAHFEETLRIPFYKHLMDSPSNVDPSNEKTYTFLQQQIDNAIRAYGKSRFFNISCDETEALGSGRAREYVDKVGGDEAYCRHINRVYDIVQERFRHYHSGNEQMEVLMWGDIVGKKPEMLKKLPKEMNYIVWSYVAQESYAGMIAPFQKLHEEQGNPFWVAPGVSHWSSIPWVRNYMQNIAYMARDGHQAGARGLMNTAWDDSGESLFGDCWHAMAWGAEMAWNPIKSTDPEEARKELAERERLFNENYDRLMKSDPEFDRTEAGSDHTTEMIYKVGDLASNEWVGDWYNTGALMQPLMEFYPSNVSDEMLQRCDSVDQIIWQILNQIDSTAVPHFYYGCHRILCVSEKSRLRVMLHRGDPTSPTLAQQYFEHLHQLKLEYLRLWDEESTDYSRNVICDRYDRLGNEVLELDRKVVVETSGDTITLRTLLEDNPIYYTLDGRKPTTGSLRYNGPFVINHSCLIKAVSHNRWDEPVYSERYLLHHQGMGHLVRLNTPYSTYNATYSGGGDKALSDGCLGSDDSYADGHWQGYWGEDIDAEYDFGAEKTVESVSLRFLQNTFDWILAPERIEVYSSTDGKDWTMVRAEDFHPEFRIGGNILRTETLHGMNLSTRYLRVVAKNPGPLPAWHGSHGQPSYLFCDEIVIE